MLLSWVCTLYELPMMKRNLPARPEASSQVLLRFNEGMVEYGSPSNGPVRGLLTAQNVDGGWFLALQTTATSTCCFKRLTVPSSRGVRIIKMLRHRRCAHWLFHRDIRGLTVTPLFEMFGDLFNVEEDEINEQVLDLSESQCVPPGRPEVPPVCYSTGRFGLEKLSCQSLFPRLANVLQHGSFQLLDFFKERS